MKNHVVTKETAILLKEAGFPQETNYYWIKNSQDVWVLSVHKQGYFKDRILAAPLATEILGELRNGVYILCAGGGGKIVDYVVGENFSTRELWSIALDKGFHRDTTPFELRDKNLSEGLAKMYIYLKQNNLI